MTNCGVASRHYNKPEKIQDRALRFGVKLTKFIFRLHKSFEMRVLLDQLLRSGTSIGANLEEADSASSRKDFINKLLISKKEARETRYWLTIIKETGLLSNEGNLMETQILLDEVEQLVRIIGAIHAKARRKNSE